MINPLIKFFANGDVKPFYLILNVTNRCNSSCSTCFAWNYLNKDPESELGIEEIRGLSGSLDTVYWLLISGGEPFLRKDLVEVIEVFYKQNKTRRVTIPTNATLTEKICSDVASILEKCPDLKLVISISLDGVGRDHDEIRGFPDNFKKLGETYKKLVELKRDGNLSINLNTCISNRNISKIEGIIDYSKENFEDVDFHGFELLRGVPRDPSFKTPSIGEYERVMEKIKAYWKDMGFYNMSGGRLIKASKILARDIELEVLKGSRKTPCLAGRIAGVVSARGDVSLCELLEPVGNIRENEFGDIWTNEKAGGQRGIIKRREGVCKNCTHSCFISSALLFTPRFYPRLLWYALRFS